MKQKPLKASIIIPTRGFDPKEILNIFHSNPNLVANKVNNKYIFSAEKFNQLSQEKKLVLVDNPKPDSSGVVGVIYNRNLHMINISYLEFIK